MSASGETGRLRHAATMWRFIPQHIDDKDIFVATASFMGVYSTGTPAVRRQGASGPRKRYWFVWDDLRGGRIVQLLDAAYKPVSEPQPISEQEFSQRYRLESSVFVTPISKLELPDEVVDADLPLSVDVPAELTGRTPEQSLRSIESAAALDRDLREEFSTALAKLQRGDKASAVNALERLAGRREGIVPAHKHMFTDFAVNLRKSRMHAVAFKFYQRALELSPEDSNAYFNMARIMFDLGDYEGTEKHLQQALNLDVDFIEAKRFLDYLLRQGRRRSAHSSGRNKVNPDELLLLK